ncbi:MAG: lipoprotein-releasing ABC transporter permease subunit [Nitrospirae bacterium]|nr:lipoprotein-releasing ABC transporter permease subunit [Nitrospirota bacterium]
MKLSYEFFIGLRYLKAKRKQFFISFISIISMIGVALGVWALIVVLSVMTGFEEDLRSKILGTNSHIVITDRREGGIKNYKEIISKIEKIEHVASATPFIYNQVMLTTESNVTGVVLRGIDPLEEGKVTDIKKNIKDGSLDALNSQEKAGIIIGKELSRRLIAFVGDKITVVSPIGTIGPMGTIPKMKAFEVVGIFESGMYEYDSTLAYISIKNAQQFFNMGDVVSGVEVRLDNIYIAREVSEKIQSLLGFPYWARDWGQMNRNLFSALALERVAMFIILTLIILVAAFNIVSTLIMIVMEKNKDIAILMAMGATKKGIMKIFIFDGLMIGIVGTAIGIVTGYISCILLAKYQFITLPSDIYYISHLPVKVKPFYILLIAVSAIMVSFLATLYPSYQAAKLDPAETLRYE